MRTISIIIATIVLAFAASAQRSPIVMFYNVESLYDTIPSRFYDDRAYTPAGRFGWDSNRYTHKIKQVAAVVDSIALPVVALYGVENEQVVKDIVTACRGDYSYIHRTSGGYDGLDFALLYFGDMFVVERWCFARPLNSTTKPTTKHHSKASNPIFIILCIVFLSRYTSNGCVMLSCAVARP